MKFCLVFGAGTSLGFFRCGDIAIKSFSKSNNAFLRLQLSIDVRRFLVLILLGDIMR